MWTPTWPWALGWWDRPSDVLFNAEPPSKPQTPRGTYRHSDGYLWLHPRCLQVGYYPCDELVPSAVDETLPVSRPRRSRSRISMRKTPLTLLSRPLAAGEAPLAPDVISAKERRVCCKLLPRYMECPWLEVPQTVAEFQRRSALNAVFLPGEQAKINEILLSKVHPPCLVSLICSFVGDEFLSLPTLPFAFPTLHDRELYSVAFWWAVMALCASANLTLTRNNFRIIADNLLAPVQDEVRCLDKVILKLVDMGLLKDTTASKDDGAAAGCGEFQILERYKGSLSLTAKALRWNGSEHNNRARATVAWNSLLLERHAAGWAVDMTGKAIEPPTRHWSEADAEWLEVRDIVYAYNPWTSREVVRADDSDYDDVIEVPPPDALVPAGHYWSQQWCFVRHELPKSRSWPFSKPSDRCGTRWHQGVRNRFWTVDEYDAECKRITKTLALTRKEWRTVEKWPLCSRSI